MSKYRLELCISSISIIVYLLTSSVFSSYAINAAEPTSTIAPPKIKTLPPSSVIPTQVLPSTEQAPNAANDATATPNPQFAGLDEAVNNTFTAKSFRFSLSATIDIEVNGETGTLTLETDGSAANLSDPQQFLLQSVTKASLEIAGDTKAVTVEQRFINGTLYLHAYDDKRVTQWVGIKFEDIFGDIINFDPSKIDAAEIVEKIDIDKFIKVKRTDSSGDTARYETRIDAQRFLRSKEFLQLIEVMVSLGTELDIGIDLEQIKDMAPLLNVIIPTLVPVATVRINATTTTNPSLLQDVTFDIEVEVTPIQNFQALLGGSDSTEESDPIIVTIFATFSIFDYGSDVIVEVPDNVRMIESLDQLTPDILFP